MSIPFSGAWARSNGVISAIAKNIRTLNLKGVKRITVTFDPFHQNALPTRKFLLYMSTPKAQESNPSLILRTNVVCDRSEPTVVCDFLPKVQEEHKLKRLKVNAGNLTELELLQLLNKHVNPLAPVEEEQSRTTVSKKSTKGGKRK